MTRGISWSWDEARRGLICALPSPALLLGVDVSLGVVFALGTLPVALLGVPPRRAQRPRLGLVGAAFSIAYAVGCVVGQWPVVAVAALSILAFSGSTLAARRPAAALVPLILLPGFALGMNEPVPDGLVLAALFLAGGAWAMVITYCWPERAVAAAPARPATPAAPVGARRYAACFAVAAGVGLMIGFAFDFAHVAWAAAASMFIMRPDPQVLMSRAIGRTVATFAGVLLAAVIFHRGLTEIALALVVVCAISAIVAVHSSRWYVVPAGTGLVVLLMSGVSSTKQFEVTLADRLLETLIGAALALAAGIVARHGTSRG